MVERVCAEHGYDPVSFRFVIYGVGPEAKRQAEADEHRETKTPEA